MSQRMYYKYVTICDWCGRKHVKVTKEEGGEGDRVPKWAEVTLRGFREDVTRGNEDYFATLCPQCIKQLPFKFHDTHDYFEGEEE